MLSLLLLTLVSAATAQVCGGLNATFGAGGGRRIALVIDSSGSNVDNDPSDLRISAAKAFNSMLTSKSESNNGKSDLVTIIDFDSSSSVVYPLGDPSSATFDGIDSIGGTYIAGGVDEAVGELTKTTGGKDTSGIIVLTDGQDSSSARLVEAIDKASGLGIRVSVGFLQSVSSPLSPEPEVLDAISKSGGIYATIDSPETQANFVSLVATHGPTKVDASKDGNTQLLPGLAIGGREVPATYTYRATSGEKLNFTITSLDEQTYSASLKGGSGNDSAVTDEDGVANIFITAGKDGLLQLNVDVNGGNGTGVYTVGLASSLVSSTNCSALIPGGGNATNGTNFTAQVVPSPVPTTYTGAASALQGAATAVMAGLLMMAFSL